MKRIGAGLAGIIRRLGLEDAARLHGIRSRWGELVGAPLSEHLEPGFVSGAVLHITVDSPLWLEQARFYGAEILKRVGPLGISELKFKPGARRGKNASTAACKIKEPGHAPLTDEELASIDQQIGPVRDEALKQIMRGIMAKALRAPAAHGRISNQNP